MITSKNEVYRKWSKKRKQWRCGRLQFLNAKGADLWDPNLVKNVGGMNFGHYTYYKLQFRMEMKTRLETYFHVTSVNRSVCTSLVEVLNCGRIFEEFDGLYIRYCG